MIMAAALAGPAFHAQAPSGSGAEPDLSALVPEAAVELALANNRSLARSRIDLAAAERTLKNAWNDLLPGVSLSAGTSRSSATEATNLYGSLSASVTLSPVVAAAVGQARAAYESQKLAYENSRRTLELGVRKSFYSLVLAGENIAVLRQSVASAQAAYEQAEAKRRVGLATELDVLSAQVNLENLKPSLGNALLNQQSALADFKLLLAVDQDRELVLKGSLDEAAALSGLEFSGLAGESPSVKRLRATVETARAGLKAARTVVRSPSLTLSGSYRPSSSNSGPWKDNGSISATLALSLDNLLPWSNARENEARAGDSLAKSESELEEARISASVSLETLQRKVEKSLAALKARRLTVTLAERTYRLTEDAYRFGTKDLLNLQDAADSLQEARVKLLEEAYALVSALLDLEYALGVPFGTLGR